MTELTEVSCHLARDLFIPYLAGDVTSETRAWLEHHLEGCAACRAALEAVKTEMAPSAAADARSAVAASATMSVPSPSGQAGRRLLRRMKLRELVGTCVCVLFLLSIISLAIMTTWGMSVFKTFSLPSVHPVPPSSVRPQDAAAIDLSEIGLTLRQVTIQGSTATAVWLDGDNRPVTIQYSNPRMRQEAATAYHHWIESFPIKVAAWCANTLNNSRAIARVPGAYIYGWQTDTWLITMRIDSRAKNATQLCYSIREVLFKAFEGMQQAAAGKPATK